MSRNTIHKVLIVTASFPPRTGGVPQSLAALCRHFDPELIGVFTSSANGAGPADAALPYPVFRSGANVVSHMNWRSVPAFTWSIARYWADLRRAVARFNPGVILSFNCWLEQAACCCAVRSERGIPYAMYLHGEDLPLPGLLRKNDYLRMPLVNRANVLLTNSAASRSRMHDLGYGRGKTEVISAGVDTDRFTPGNGAALRKTLGIGEKDPVLLTVGRMDLRKGHDLVIRSLPSLRREFPGIRYVIVGAGPEQSRLEALAREQGVADAVLFRGFQADSALPDYYRMCDVFAMPNRTLPDGDAEGLGLVFLEAGACGKPVIGGRSGGAADAILHGTTGLLVEPDNADELTLAARLLLARPELRERLGAAGCRRAREEYSVRLQAARFWCVFMSLAEYACRERGAPAQRHPHDAPRSEAEGAT